MLSLEDPLAAFRLDGKVAAVTGAGSGIGHTIALAFARAGATVATMDVKGEAADDVAQKIRAAGGKAESYLLDVTDEIAVDRCFAAIAERHRRLDVLVNSAGIAVRVPAIELARADWDRVQAVNVTGSFLCARAAARLMLPEQRGSIVNIASIMGFSGGLYPNASYQTSKGAIVNMTRALAIEWAASGIRVNAIAPTFVRTGLALPVLRKPEVLAEIERNTPMGRIAEPEEIAAAALFLASPASSMVTGHTLPVDGGFLAR